MCDIEREVLPFNNQSVATIALCATFEHLRVDPLFALKEMRRVLEPGGLLYLTTPNLYRLRNIANFALGRGLAFDPICEYSKLRTIRHMGHVREYSTGEVARFLEACGLRVQSVGYRYHANLRGWKGKALRTAYRLTPRRFRRDIVVIAQKARDGPRLAPLVPASG